MVALPAEARPLAAGLGLARAPGPAPVALWEGPGLDLVVSGVGAGASAAAVRYLFERSGGDALRPWINVGIGGHRSLAPGAVRLATRVLDRRTGRAWYPPLAFEPPCPGAPVVTVERPETAYPEEAIYDMEAAGFCAAAAGFATAELVQVLKVVSDGPRHPLRRVGAARVEGWMAEALPAVGRILEATGELAGRLERRRRPPAGLEGWLGRARFTVTERRELERLLARLQVLAPGEACEPPPARQSTAAELLAALRRRLESVPVEVT